MTSTDQLAMSAVHDVTLKIKQIKNNSNGKKFYLTIHILLMYWLCFIKTIHSFKIIFKLYLVIRIINNSQIILNDFRFYTNLCNDCNNCIRITAYTIRPIALEIDGIGNCV